MLALYFASIAGLWTLRPVPSWTIEKYGDAWTDPGNIVTSGLYLLKQWDAGKVQLGRVGVNVIEVMNTVLALYEKKPGRCHWRVS